MTNLSIGKLTKALAIIISAVTVAGLPIFTVGTALAASEVALYTTPSQYSLPDKIVTGPDGNLWFTEQNTEAIGRIDTSGNITEFPISQPNSYPGGIALGPDGNLWFTVLGSTNSIGRITTSGSIELFHIPTANSDSQNITAGPDGAMWFTEAATSKIGRIDMNGNITEYGLPRYTQPDAITSGPDGNVWFTEDGTNTSEIGNINPSSDTITQLPLPHVPYGPEYPGITTGPDGALWFTDYANFTIDRIDTSGHVTIFPLPTNTGNPNIITEGPDGALWYTEQGSGEYQNIGRITTSGAATNYPVPGSNPNSNNGIELNGITGGPDNGIWFTELENSIVGRLSEPAAGPTDLTAPAVAKTPTLNWDAVSGASTYNIYNNGAMIGNTSSTTYTDNNAVVGTNNYYVTALTADGETLPSNVATVQSPTDPTITSANNATANVRTSFNFQITSSATPTASITESGTLPSGITFTDNGDGTANIMGIPVDGSSGSYPLTITADNGSGNPSSQSFTLTVASNTTVPSFVSSNTDTETYGVPFSFTIQTNGYPNPTITKTSGTLPKDINFTDNGDGTATISGTPSAASDMGVYNLSFKAKNSLGTATQTFSLTLTKAPILSHIPNKTAYVGQPFSMTIKSSGYYTPSLSIGNNASLPQGLTFTDNGNGTATISGTPQNYTDGTYTIQVTAANQLGNASQSFNISVDSAPTFTSSDQASATIGSAFTYQVSSDGFPAPSYKESGTLPKGVKFNSNGTFSGTPANNTAGNYPLTITAKNSSGSATQSFTLTVNQ
jgi:streptogramin lyase